MKTLLGVLAGASALLVLSPAGAAAQVERLEAPSTFTFDGGCVDCTFSRATLTNRGTTIDYDNFVSFVYVSDLTSFTITNPTAFILLGSLSNLPGANSVRIVGQQPGSDNGTVYDFMSDADGSWRVELDTINFDFGLEHSWDSLVPEPATWAMMIGGFGLVGAALRRRAKVAVRFG